MKLIIGIAICMYSMHYFIVQMQRTYCGMVIFAGFLSHTHSMSLLPSPFLLSRHETPATPSPPLLNTAHSL